MFSKILLSDNALEHVQINNKTIMHQTTCAHTPHENEAVERKIDISMILPGHNPCTYAKMFLGKRCLTAHHIDEKSSIFCLHSKTLFFILHPTQPLFFPSKIFGSFTLSAYFE